MIVDKVQVAVLGLPVKLAGGGLIAILLAVTVDPIFGAVGLLFLSAALGLLTTWYWFQKNQAIKDRDTLAAAHQKLVDRVTQIETESRVLAQAMLPVTEVFKAILVKELTHLHEPEMDALLVKLGPPSALTPQEEDRLAALLEARTRDLSPEITPLERDAALMMPMLIRRARAEAAIAATAPKPDLKLVAMTVVVEDPSGGQKALLIPTQAPSEARDLLAIAIAENTRLTRETNAALKRQNGD